MGVIKKDYVKKFNDNEEVELAEYARWYNSDYLTECYTKMEKAVKKFETWKDVKANIEYYNAGYKKPTDEEITKTTIKGLEFQTVKEAYRKKSAEWLELNSMKDVVTHMKSTNQPLKADP